jgi:peptidoglycan DL-endopeptidase CwlO
MKWRPVVLCFFAMAVAFTPHLRATTEEDDSLGARIKRMFVRHTPTPTPTPRKRVHKKSTPAAEQSQSSSPASVASATPASSSPSETVSSPARGESVSPSPAEFASPETAAESSETPPSPTATETRSSRSSRTQYFEPVRPISPPPGTRSHAVKTPPAEIKIPPTEESAKPGETPAATASVPLPKTKVAIETAQIVDYDTYSTETRKILDLGLDLAGQNLRYKYNSADPARGGMDSSGFIHYLLSKSGIKDVPRDARDQYIWVRKSGNFQVVLAQRDDTFELNALKPGDLLFWANTNGISRDPDVTQTMIYLGREKGNNQRIMIGSSEGRTFKGQQRSGVNVFDFKVGRAKQPKSDEPGPTFVGYARVPGLSTE